MNRRKTAPVRHALMLAVIGALAGPLPVQAINYIRTDLGQLNGSATAARALNNLGQVVGDTAFSTPWIWSADTGMRAISPLGPTATAGGAYGINDAGTVVGNFSFAGASSPFIWSGGATVLIPTASGASLSGNSINASGQFVGNLTPPFPASQQAYRYDPALGRLEANTLATLGSSATAINDCGHVAGWVSTGGVHPMLWKPGVGFQDLDPSNKASGYALALNNRDQVVGLSYDSQGQGRAFVWSPDVGMQRLGTLARDSRATGINDNGQVVGWADANSTGTPVGAFLWTAGSGMVDLNSRLAVPGGARITYAGAVNQLGQIVGQDENLHAVLLTPTGDLAWQGASGGDFSDGRNWEMDFTPSRFLDAQVHTAGVQTIKLSRDTAVNSLGLGAASGGRPTLLLQDGASLSAAYGVTVRATGTLTGDGTVQGAVVNLGTVQGSSLRIAGGLQNQGLINVQAGTPGVLEADLQNLPGGQLRLERSERLRLVGAAHGNAGTFEVRGGELEITGALDNAAGGRLLLGQAAVLRLNQDMANCGQINVGFGGAEVFGDVLNKAGAKIVLSGNSNTTFYDAVTVESGGELRVSAGSTALFFGLVRQADGAIFSGTGTKFYEGQLLIGGASARGVDEGSVVLGAAAELDADIGGLAAGSDHDQLQVAGELHFVGTLKLRSSAGFVAQDGQRFDLFDWGSSSGRFERIDASDLQLGPGLMLDTSRLYIDGSLGVSAVPEPASWALMLGGAGWLLRRARPVAAGSGAARC